MLGLWYVISCGVATDGAGLAIQLVWTLKKTTYIHTAPILSPGDSSALDTFPADS